MLKTVEVKKIIGVPIELSLKEDIEELASLDERYLAATARRLLIAGLPVLREKYEKEHGKKVNWKNAYKEK